MSLLLWVLAGWIGTFWYCKEAKMLDDPFTWLLIVFNGAVIGPFSAVLWLIDPPHKN